MPSHTKTNKPHDYYTIAPVLIFQLLSYLRLTPTESMTLNYIVLESTNVYGVNHSNARKWVTVSLASFGQDRGLSRQAIHAALQRLIDIGLINTRPILVQTNSGAQIGREYRLVNNEELSKLSELFCASVKPVKGVKQELTPQKSKKVLGVKPDFTPCQAPLDTLSGRALHLVRPHLTPWGVNPERSLRNFKAKYSLNIIKSFLNKLPTFENSFYNLHATSANSKAAMFKIETQIAGLIRRYSLFSVYIAMLACLFSKDADLGNFEAIKAFLENNSEKLRDLELNLITQSDNLYQELFTLYQNTDSTRLENFREIFKANASVLLAKKQLEQSSSGLFFYDSFNDNVIEIFESCNFNMTRFTSTLVSKLNLYFKAKLLGIKGLNFV